MFIRKILTTYNAVETFFSSATGLIFFVAAIVDAVVVEIFRVQQIFGVHQLQRWRSLGCLTNLKAYTIL